MVQLADNNNYAVVIDHVPLLEGHIAIEITLKKDPAPVMEIRQKLLDSGNFQGTPDSLRITNKKKERFVLDFDKKSPKIFGKYYYRKKNRLPNEKEIAEMMTKMKKWFGTTMRKILDETLGVSNK